MDRPCSKPITYEGRPRPSHGREDYQNQHKPLNNRDNEAKLIQRRLDNIYGQDYPKSLMEVIVVDSANSDGTAELVEEWVSKYRDTVKVIER